MRSADSCPAAGEHKSGRQVAPDDLPLNRTEVLLEQSRKIEFSQLAAPQLQAMQILILRERPSLLQANTDFAQKRVPLAVRHESHCQRRKDRIHLPVPAPAQFLEQ